MPASAKRSRAALTLASPIQQANSGTRVHPRAGTASITARASSSGSLRESGTKITSTASNSPVPCSAPIAARYCAARSSVSRSTTGFRPVNRGPRARRPPLRSMPASASASAAWTSSLILGERKPLVSMRSQASIAGAPPLLMTASLRPWVRAREASILAAAKRLAKVRMRTTPARA